MCTTIGGAHTCTSAGIIFVEILEARLGAEMCTTIGSAHAARAFVAGIRFLQVTDERLDDAEKFTVCVHYRGTHIVDDKVIFLIRDERVDLTR
jgi:hypothetical protein